MASGTSTTASPKSRYATSPPFCSPQRRRAAAGRLICPRCDTLISPVFDMEPAYKASESSALYSCGDRFGPNRPTLTVSGAVFVCTGPH